MPPPINIPSIEAGTDDTGDAKDHVKSASFISYAFRICLFVIVVGFPSLFYWGNGQYDAGVRDGSGDKARLVQQYYENWQVEHQERLAIQQDKDSLQSIINNIYRDENRKQFEIFKMKLNSSGGAKVITIKPQS